ncbi:MAG: hypothetical protein OER97_05615 [Gammaproteobacteria bacterium]|nr:hypothetical protein [Gammaproteobacteria bacterium]
MGPVFQYGILRSNSVDTSALIISRHNYYFTSGNTSCINIKQVIAPMSLIEQLHPM